MKLISCIIFALLITGCATANKINKIQIGMTKTEVISTIGDPTSISAKDGVEYLNYRLSETDDHAFYGITTPYYVRLIEGKVESYGRLGDFNSTNTPSINIKKQENITIDKTDKPYSDLEKIKELYDRGILNKEEYQQEKEKILRSK